MDVFRTNLEAALEEAQMNYEIDFRSDYQGRYHEASEVAVVGEQQALEEFELLLAAYSVVDHLDFDDANAREMLDAIINLRDMRREDSMGMDRIFYYPHVTVVDNK